MPENTIPLSLKHWSQLPNGEQIKGLVEHILTPWWPKVFGYHMLNLGELSANLKMPELPIARRFSLFDGDDASLRANFTALPIQNGVIDAVVMSMLLEFEKDPYKLLRETDRVLISGGYLFIIGFNPLSPVFIGKLLPKYQQQSPWNGRFFMPSRVKDWLGLLGYQVISDERFLYHHLLTHLKEKSLWQDALQAWLPSSGSLYLIVARKLELPLTPIHEKRKMRQTRWTTAPSAGRNEHFNVENKPDKS